MPTGLISFVVEKQRPLSNHGEEILMAYLQGDGNQLILEILTTTLPKPVCVYKAS